MKNFRRAVGGGSALACLMGSLWTAFHVVLGHIATTCTMGDDDAWIAGMVFSAPTALLTWWLLLRMTRRGLSPDGWSVASTALPLANLFLLPTLAFGIQDARNLYLYGALCGADYGGYAPELTDIGYWATRSLVVVYFNAVPLLTLALSAAALLQRRKAASAADEV